MNQQKLASTFLTAIFASFILFSGCESGNYENVELQDNIDSVSYAFGYLTGKQMAASGMNTIEPELYAAGMRQALAEDSSLIDQQKMMALFRDYQVDARARMMKQRMEEAEENKQKAQEFLAQNREKEGVKVTESGLQYKILQEGSGKSPTAQDSVTVHYKGTLLSGEVFDSSYKRGQPITFPLDGVIAGWTEGLQLMEEGAVYKFWIPGKLAYGMRPPRNSPIGPNELLIFKVELIEVN